MALKTDIRYMPIYTDGSAARKIEPQRKRKKKVELPRPIVHREAESKVIYVDPLAVCALLSAVVLLVAMVVGLFQLGQVNDKQAQLQENIALLKTQQTALNKAYKAGYDLEEIEKKALEMGLVSVDSVEHIPIRVEIPQEPAEPTFWENVTAFWQELFA